MPIRRSGGAGQLITTRYDCPMLRKVGQTGATQWKKLTTCGNRSLSPLPQAQIRASHPSNPGDRLQTRSESPRQRAAQVEPTGADRAPSGPVPRRVTKASVTPDAGNAHVLASPRDGGRRIGE